MLSEATQQQLLAFARATLTRHLGGDAAEVRVNEEAQAPQGAFVSLHTREQHELRGCIGTFAFTEPLLENVRRMAIACGTEDPRFPPVRLAEMPGLLFEISAMTPPQPIQPDDVVVGTHGLIIQKGMRRGVLLPQVASERSWSREEFLRQTCRKAGLSEEAYLQSDTSISAFTAQVYTE